MAEISQCPGSVCLNGIYVYWFHSSRVGVILGTAISSQP